MTVRRPSRRRIVHSHLDCHLDLLDPKDLLLVASLTTPWAIACIRHPHDSPPPPPQKESTPFLQRSSARVGVKKPFSFLVADHFRSPRYI